MLTTESLDQAAKYFNREIRHGRRVQIGYCFDKKEYAVCTQDDVKGLGLTWGVSLIRKIPGEALGCDYFDILIDTRGICKQYTKRCINGVRKALLVKYEEHMKAARGAGALTAEEAERLLAMDKRVLSDG